MTPCCVILKVHYAVLSTVKMTTFTTILTTCWMQISTRKENDNQKGDGIVSFKRYNRLQPEYFRVDLSNHSMIQKGSYAY